MAIEIEALRKLTNLEKLRIVTELWDDIANSHDPFPLQSWQKDEATRRAEELDLHPEIALTREEVWKQVDEAHG